VSTTAARPAAYRGFGILVVEVSAPRGKRRAYAASVWRDGAAVSGTRSTDTPEEAAAAARATVDKLLENSDR
jgi:hypothetical protein